MREYEVTAGALAESRTEVKRLEGELQEHKGELQALLGEKNLQWTILEKFREQVRLAGHVLERGKGHAPAHGRGSRLVGSHMGAAACAAAGCLRFRVQSFVPMCIAQPAPRHQAHLRWHAAAGMVGSLHPCCQGFLTAACIATLHLH